MGADLTIAESGKYFRDSYNTSNTWWVIGLSYWGMNEFLKKGKLLKEGNVTPKGVKFIWDKIKEKPLTEKRVIKFIAKNRVEFGLSTHKYTPDNIKKIIKEIKKDDEKMRDFWKEAAKLKSSVSFNV